MEDLDAVRGRLRHLLETGAVVLVKGSWLMHQAYDLSCPRAIPRREDLPAEAVWGAEEALARLDKSEREWAVRSREDPTIPGQHLLFLWSVSCCWCSPDHPDPEGYHLERVGKILRSRVGRVDGRVPDVGVFWDYMSILQKPTTEDAERLRREAMFDLHLLFGHALAMVVKLKGMPECPHTLDQSNCYRATGEDGQERLHAWGYDCAGWSMFESAVADLRLVVSGSRLQFQDEVGDDLWEPWVLKMRYQTKAVPMHPERFAGKLASCRFSKGCDFAFVLGLYRKAFQALQQTKIQVFKDVDWSDEPKLAQYVEVLKDFKELQSFRMERCKLSTRGVASLSQALAMQGCVKEIWLDKVNLRQEGLKALAVGLPPNLKQLCLAGNQIAAEGIRALCGGLPPQLEVLHLEYNELSDDGAGLLVDMLPPSLRKLWLAQNHISDAGASVLGRLEARTPLLEVLHLGDNEIADPGVRKLCEGLPASLKKLGLAKNLITDAGAQSIAHHLHSTTPFLEVLHLTNNEISDDGVKGLCQELPYSLKKLRLAGNDLSEEGMCVLRSSRQWVVDV